MINPKSYAGCVGAISFMVGQSTNGRQYTFVEVSIDKETESSQSISFYVPNGTEPKDESTLCAVMGGRPINDAKDAWRRKQAPIQNAVCVAGFLAVENSLSSKVSGCDTVAVVVSPINGPCTINACWSHLSVPDSTLMVPTQNEDLRVWNNEVVVIGCRVPNMQSQQPVTPPSRSIRWDLAYQCDGVCFGTDLDNSVLLSINSASLPFHNLWIPTKENADPRLYKGFSGVRVADCTSQRLLCYHEVNFTTVPVVCGAFIRNVANFPPPAFCPLVLHERASRERDIVFRDDGTCVLLEANGVPRYRIDPTKKYKHANLYWVDLIRI